MYSCTSFENIQAIIAMIWPFLSIIKRKQAARALIEIRDHKRVLRDWWDDLVNLDGSAFVPDVIFGYEPESDSRA